MTESEINDIKEVFKSFNINGKMAFIENMKKDSEAMGYEGYRELVKWFEGRTNAIIQDELKDASTDAQKDNL